MNVTDVPGGSHELVVWGGGIFGLITAMLGIRRIKSNDDTTRARNSAEAGVYNSALAEKTEELKRLRASNDDLEQRYLASEIERARIGGRMDAQDREIDRLRQEVLSLRRMIGRLAEDPKLRHALGPDFVVSQESDLDDTPTIPLPRREP